MDKLENPGRGAQQHLGPNPSICRDFLENFENLMRTFKKKDANS